MKMGFFCRSSFISIFRDLVTLLGSCEAFSRGNYIKPKQY